jgi:hypothetical protein
VQFPSSCYPKRLREFRAEEAQSIAKLIKIANIMLE